MRIGMKMIVIVTLGSLFAVACPTEATTFDLLGTEGAAVDGEASDSVTVDGITATLTATPNGVLNGTASNFGINSDGADETTRIDDDDDSEVLELIFDQNVNFVSFTVTSSSGATVVAYTVGTVTDTFDFPSGGGTFAITLPGGGELISTSDTLTFGIDGSSGATGYSLDSFTVEVVPTPAALPAGLALIGFLAARRRR